MQLYEPQTQDMRAKIKNSYIYIMHKWCCFPQYLHKCKCDIDFIQQVNIVLHYRHNIVCFDQFHE